MICAWKEFIRILPEWMRNDVDKQGSAALQELRLRLGKPPELKCERSGYLSGRTVSPEDIHYCINTASQYSPWASESVKQGYLTTAGGHRIGICGQAAVLSGQIQNIRTVSSVCIRIARDFPGLAASLADLEGSVLIIGGPGRGKTTLLRDLIRQKAKACNSCVAVVDERGELFPPNSGFERGLRTDVMTGCNKMDGIEMLLRCMGPSVIAVDEITAEEDCEAMIRAGWSGVDLFATAHARDVSDLRARSIYRKLWDCGLFRWIVTLQADKSWSVERVGK